MNNMVIENEKIYKDNSNNYNQNEMKKEDGELMGGSDNYKNREKERPREKERNINRDFRDTHERSQYKDKYERREKNLKEGRRNSFSRKEEENYNYAYEDFRNKNKNYEIREEYDKNKANRRNYMESRERERHVQNFVYKDQYSDEKDKHYLNPQIEIERREKHSHSNREDIKHGRGDKHGSFRRKEDEEDLYYGHSYSYERDRFRDTRDKGREDDFISDGEEDSAIGINGDLSEKLKKFNFLIILPKNYFRIIEEDYDYIIREVR
jgi:hypothetical protein